MNAPERSAGASLSRWLELALAVAALTIVLVVVYQIFARTASLSIRWTDEFARLVCIWGVFLALPVLIRRNGLIRIEFFFNYLPPSLRRLIVWFEFLVLLFALVFLTVLTAYQAAQSWDQTSPGLLWPMGLFSLPIGIGSLLSLYFMFESRRQLLADASDKHDDVTGAAL